MRTQRGVVETDLSVDEPVVDVVEDVKKVEDLKKVEDVPPKRVFSHDLKKIKSDRK